MNRANESHEERTYSHLRSKESNRVAAGEDYVGDQIAVFDYDDGLVRFIDPKDQYDDPLNA